MKKELRQILISRKAEISKSMTKGVLYAVLAKLESMLTMEDVQLIKCTCKNKGVIWASDDLLDCIKRLSDNAFTKFASTLRDCHEELYHLLQYDCKVAGLDRFLFEEVVNDPIDKGSGTVSKRERARLVLSDLRSMIRTNITVGQLSYLLTYMQSELAEDDIQQIKCTLDQNGVNRAADELVDHILVASKNSFTKFIRFFHDESKNTDLYAAMEEAFCKAGLHGLLPKTAMGQECQPGLLNSAKDKINDAMQVSMKSDTHGQHAEHTLITPEQPQSQHRSKDVRYCIGGSTLEMHQNSGLQEPDQVLEKYEMSRKPAGICLIISNEDFSETRNSAKGFQDRCGTDVDVQNLREVFTWLGFSVQIMKNLKALQMWNILLEYKNKNHSNYDCFVVCILSHGLQFSNVDIICGIDGKPIKAAEIFSLFDGNNCPSLIGKPKLFFLQCCRGKLEDPGSMHLSMTYTDGPCDSNSEVLPVASDFFIGYATPPGYKSWRNTEKGSWYISKLCEVLERMACQFDFLTMMTEVNNLVSKFYTENRCMQVPNPSITLRKQLYFSPMQ